MKFYIVAPSKTATGGPELLHQLARKLLDRDLDVKMYYLPQSKVDSIHENYLAYDIPVAKNIVDEINTVLIVPEIYTRFLRNFNFVKKVIWWLSVDNYFFTQPILKGKVNSKIYKILNSQKYIFFDKSLTNDRFLHLYQSEYAKLFLRKHKVNNLLKLSDYLHPTFVNQANKLYEKDKKNIVSYNPLKGKNFTENLIKNCNDIEFVPIINMTRKEVVELLSSSKVYIDFGFHPGKDRIPREAVLLGNCILTSRKGSANNLIDIPIASDYKFKDKNENIKAIISMLHYIFDNYEIEKKKFLSYRNEIIQQESVFEKEIDRFLEAVNS